VSVSERIANEFKADCIDYQSGHHGGNFNWVWRGGPGRFKKGSLASTAGKTHPAAVKYTTHLVADSQPSK